MEKTGNKIQKLCFRKSKIIYCIMQMLFVFLSFILFAQNASALESCYVASDSTNRLTFVADRTDGSTSIDVGPFGASLIEALAKDPLTGTVYAANANQLGTVNLDTGAFTATSSTFGTALAANGDLTSNVGLNDIDALAFDLSTGFLYGVQNASGPEVLFRINPATGAIIPGVMGGGNDYLLVNTTGSIDDLAIDQAATMFASNAGSLYTINFAATGTTSATLIGSFGGPNDMEGLSTDVPGNLIGSTGANNSTGSFNNSIWSISKTTGAASNQVFIPIGGDYEGITCALANVDLSLSKTAALTNDADSSGTITVGDEVTYSITVGNNDANQIASGVEVTDNINTLAGLTFVSSSTTKATPNPYDSATGVWSVGVVPANTSYQLDLVYSVGAAAGGNTITNTAEVTQSANPDPDSEPDNDDGDQSEDDEDNATITVNFATLTISKSFGADPIAIGGISTLTITLGNINATAATLTANLVDTLPTAGNGDVVVATTPNIGGTCNSANVTAIAGTTAITYASGATIPAGGCTITVDVTSATAGIYTNTIAADALQTDLGNNTTAASDSLTVSTTTPPTVTKSFSPNSITAGGTSQLTIALGNSNASTITLSANMDDNLPSGVTASSVNGATTCPGTVDISTNTRVRYISGATIPSGGCNIVVDVTSNTLGVVTNTILTGALQTNLGSNANPASDSLTVNAGGGGTPSCPAGTSLVNLATPRNATTATSTGNVTGTISNGTGPILAIGTNVAGSGEPRLRFTPASVTLGFPDIVPLNGTIIMSLAQDNAAGVIDIQDSTDNSIFSAPLSFTGSNPIDDRIEHLNYNVASPNGAQFVRFTLTAGGFRVDGLQYSQICEPISAADLSITKNDGSLTYTPGGTGTYTIVVTNNGPDNVTGATITDDLPNGVTMTSAWTCTPSSGSSSCNTAPSTTDPISIDVDIVNGDTITVTVPVQFSSNMGDYLP